MKKLFANTRGLIDFILKREKIIMSIWILSLCLFFIGLAPIFGDILETTSDMTAIIETMKNPAMIAMVGPMYVEDAYTIGSMYSSYMMVYGAILMAVLNIFFVSRHTRGDEEAGRLEMLRSLSLGRLSNIASVIIVAFFANLIIGLITSFGLYFISSEMPLVSCLIYGCILFESGLLFAAITLAFAQITTSNRTLMGLSFFLLFAFYIVRAIGDNYSETLSLLSPLGLILRTENFIHDKTWPLLILAGEILVFLLISLLLGMNRDLGVGFIQERQGRKHASPLLQGIYTFSLKLSLGYILLWILIIFAFAGMYGSVFGDLESYISSSDMMKQMFEIDGGKSITDQFIAMLMAIMSIISTIPVLSLVHRIIGEEKKFMSEEILVHSVSKYDYLGSYFFLSFALSILLPLASALGFWAVGQYFLETVPSLEIFVKAATLYIPAILLMLGISTLFIGILPKITWLNYLFLGFCFLSVYLGKIIDLPQVLEEISPFSHVVQYPLEEIQWETSFIMIGIFLVLSFLGFVSYRRRDLL